MSVERKRILVAEDHADFLREIRVLLNGQYEIVGAVVDGEALVEAVQTLQPDLVICDVTMPVMTGFEAISKIHSLGLTSKFIFLTVHASPVYVRQAQSLGAEGYVLKVHAGHQLLPAISSVLAGQTFISPEAAISH